MYVRFGYGYSRQSNYCALVTSVQNTLASYRKVRPFAFNSNLRYVRVLRATCRQTLPVVLRAYAVIFHSQDDRKRYLSANITLYATYFLLKNPQHTIC